MHLGRLFDRSARKRRKAVDLLYEHIRDVARHPLLYRQGAVPDTIDGRFEMLVLHLGFVMRRLSAGDAEARAFAQDLFDRFVQDMDQGLREAGVGDLTVPKRLKTMTRVWYGHLRAMDDELAPADAAGRLKAVLPQFLERNLFGGVAPAPDLGPLAAYVHRQWSEALSWDADAIVGSVHRLGEAIGSGGLVRRPHAAMFAEAPT